MKASGALTQEIVKELFDYRDGALYWKVVEWRSTRKIGDRAGSLKKHGYRQIGIRGKQYYEHRIIFLYFHGFMPIWIDHDKGKQDNRIENLRESTYQENSCNIGIRKTNKSGYIGVHWHNRDLKYQVAARLNRRRVQIGYFTCPIEGAKAYDDFVEKNYPVGFRTYNFPEGRAK